MNENDVIADMLTKVKPYIGTPVKQSSFSNTIIRHKAGLLKPATLFKFLNDMGYTKTSEGWIKN
jgi:hypothetical protein